MSENEHHTLILTDANILIDYASCGMEVLALVSEYLAPVVVPDVILCTPVNSDSDFGGKRTVA